MERRPLGPVLLSAALGGTCLGFLPHNFSPARIFMGDSGSMLAGLMLAASATTYTPSNQSNRTAARPASVHTT